MRRIYQGKTALNRSTSSFPSVAINELAYHITTDLYNIGKNTAGLQFHLAQLRILERYLVVPPSLAGRHLLILTLISSDFTVRLAKGWLLDNIIAFYSHFD